MLQAALEFSLRQTMQRVVRPMLHPLVPVGLQRSLIRKAYLTSIPPRHCVFQDIEAEGIKLTRVSCTEEPRGITLYFHGGGYVLGSPSTHRGLTGQLARASNTMVIVPDYRLAPENPFPAALEDAETIYRALLDEGHPPEAIAFAGDSAGGGLAIALALLMRDKGLPLPSSITVFSPWVDLTNSNLYAPEREPLLTEGWISRSAQHYRGSEALTNPLISPVYGDFSGLPPLLIQVGSEEILLNDAQRLAEAASRDGVDVKLETFNSLWHVFQVHAGQLTRATRALQDASDFIRRHLTIEEEPDVH